MQGILIATLVVGVVGLVLGLALVTASKKFYVETDERVTQVRECLRGANCGACGYAGCAAVAEAIVKGKARVDACPGNSTENIAKIAAILGKETIDTYNTSNTRGNSPPYGMNYQQLGKDFATVDALAVLDGGKCILQLRGVRPFLSDKYDLTQHPNYKYTSDYDKKNEFNIEQFLSRRLKLKAGDEFVVVDAD